MSRTHLTADLHSEVVIRAQQRCEYCHFPEEYSFIPYEVDHVIAEQHGGET